MLSSIARLILRLGGWEILGARPKEPQGVIIAYPHTSNWDGFWALTCKVALKLNDVRFFGKHSLFWFPLGNLLRALGGIPLDRKRAGGAVQQAVDLLAQGEPMLFALAPEGTRSKRDHWKNGFYRIAMEADVPVTLALLDFGKRRIGLSATLKMTGDVEHDLARLREEYADVIGRRPELASDIRFASDPLEKR
ncbi:MAG: lysophospholipid acyltransferase family protein [Pseudomonadota bacterium]